MHKPAPPKKQTNKKIAKNKNQNQTKIKQNKVIS